MPSRQLSERRDQHSLFNVVKREAGKPELIRSLTQCCCGVNVTAEIQSFAAIHGLFRFVAEPELTQPEGWVLGQSTGIQPAVMVATDQKHVGIQSVVQVLEISQ
jgi:hypothetical protein